MDSVHCRRHPVHAGIRPVPFEVRFVQCTSCPAFCSSAPRWHSPRARYFWRFPIFLPPWQRSKRSSRMIACPDRTATRFALAGAIAAAGIALVTAAGTAGERTARDDGRILLAQAAPAGPTTSPVRLVPPGGAQPGSARSEETNRPEPPPTSSSGDARPPDDVGVTATALSDLDTAAVGLIDSSEGGLGISIWNGSKRSLIEKLISKLPARTRSVAARKLAIRLLATRAEAPRGASGGPDLLTSRVSRMVELGEVDAATRLADQISIERTGETLARSAVEALFPAERQCRRLSAGPRLRPPVRGPLLAARVRVLPAAVGRHGAGGHNRRRPRRTR